MTPSELERLGSRHHQEFEAYARTLTKDPTDAKDLLQEVIYLVIKHRDKYLPGTNFRAWVKTIIRNTYFSEFRRGQRRRDLLERDRPARGWFGDKTTDNPAESSLAAEDIMARVEALPPPYREAFLLYLRGLPYRDMSLRLNVPVGTAKSRVFTARRMLREVLGGVC